jgi:hypothetical protein
MARLNATDIEETSPRSKVRQEGHRIQFENIRSQRRLRVQRHQAAWKLSSQKRLSRLTGCVGGQHTDQLGEVGSSQLHDGKFDPPAHLRDAAPPSTESQSQNPEPEPGGLKNKARARATEPEPAIEVECYCYGLVLRGACRVETGNSWRDYLCS